MAKPTVQVTESLTAERTRHPLTPAQQLRRQWRATSLRDGWTRPDDWWAPEVDAMTTAVLAAFGAPSPYAVAELGRARAEAGVGLPETLDDLYALYRLLPEGVPPPDVLRRLAEAWVEAGMASSRTTTCEDPLSGLTSAAYLRTRLAEVYREAERSGRALRGSHALVVVRCHPPSLSAERPATGPAQNWNWMVHRLLLGDVLRSAFSGGETFAALSTAVTVGLVVRDDALPLMLRGLGHQLRRYEPTSRARIWIEGLPVALPAAYQLMGDLER
ncbi:MAG: hypothetical protein ACRDT4_25165 [Micromonosporaceae bacterium]